MRELSEKNLLNLPFSPEGRRPSSPRPYGEREGVRGKDQMRGLTAQRDRARRLRREQTDAERTLWKALRSRQFSGLKFRRQHPIGPYIVDFCCLDLKLAIELDGGQHASQTDADDRRSHCLAQTGYRVLRFWNHEVLMNLEGVLHCIAESIVPSPLPSPKGRGRTAVSSPISHSTFHIPHSMNRGGC
jgi:very-short-patch-repair endonuclease